MSGIRNTLAALMRDGSTASVDAGLGTNAAYEALLGEDEYRSKARELGSLVPMTESSSSRRRQ